MKNNSELITELVKLGVRFEGLKEKELTEMDYGLMYTFLTKDFLPVFKKQVELHGDYFNWKRHILDK